MGLKKFALILFMLVIAALPALAQRDSIGLTTIVSKTEKLTTEHPFEKVYIHFDKPYYAVGDTIWFKAYLTFYLHQPSPISKIIYVDILSSRDSLIQTLKLQVKNSVAWGDIPTSKYTFKKGNYRVVAYTNFMNNT